MVHEPTMFAHYSSVWAEMDRNSFVIVLTGVFSSSEEGEHGTGKFFNIEHNSQGCDYYIIHLLLKHIVLGRLP